MRGARRRFRGPSAMLAACTPVLVAVGYVLSVVEPAGAVTPLAALLAICAVVGTRVSFDVEGTLFWDGSFLPLICTVALLGPWPAVGITLLSELAAWQRERYRAQVLPLNVVGTVVPNLLGALALQAVAAPESPWPFYLAFVATACCCVVLNAALVTTLAGILYDAPILDRLRRHQGIVAPIAVNVVLAVGAIAAYQSAGLAATGFVIGGVFVFAFVANRLATEREHRRRIAELAESRGRLVAQILEAEDRERRALAESLHDHLIQVLLAAKQDVAERPPDGTSDRVLAQLQSAIDDARRLIRGTHPSVLDQVGLEAAVGAIAEQAEMRGVQVEVSIAKEATGHNDRLVFSAARELLTNAIKHSKAGRVSLSLQAEGDDLVLTVRDDGVGFEPTEAETMLSDGHIGLTSIRERVEALRGRLSIVPLMPGTSISVRIPHSQQQESSLRELASVGQD